MALGLSFESLVERHRSALGEGKSEGFERLVRRLARALTPPETAAEEGGEAAAASLGYEAGAAELAESVATFLDYSRSSRELVYDVLKAVRRPDAAYVLLRADPSLGTRLWMEEMGRDLGARMGWDGEGLELWKQVVEGHGQLRRLRRLYLDLYRREIFQPWSGGGSLDTASVLDRLREAGSGKSLRGNELAFGAATVFEWLEKRRLAMVEKLPGRLKGKGGGAHRSLQRAHHLRTQALWMQAESTPATGGYVFWLGEQLQALAERGIEAWEAALARSPFVLLGAEMPDIDDLRFGAFLAPHPDLTRAFPAMLEKALGGLLALAPGDIVPSPRRYSTARHRAARQVRLFARKVLQKRLMALSRDPKADPALLASFAWAFRFSEMLLSTLGAYRLGDEKAQAEALAGGDDLRIAHRVRVARFVAGWARLLAREPEAPAKASGKAAPKADTAPAAVSTAAWRRLAERMEGVASHRPWPAGPEAEQAQEPGESRVAVLGDWHPDPTLRDGRMLELLDKDFPRGIDDFAPLATTTVGLLMKALYFSDFAAKVKSVIAAEAARKEPSDPLAEDAGSLLSEAAALAADGPRPQRFLVDDYELDVKPEERATAAGAYSRAQELLMAHPKTLALEARATPPGSGKSLFWPHVFPGESSSQYQERGVLRQDVFVWSLPEPAYVVGLLQESAIARRELHPAMAALVHEGDAEAVATWEAARYLSVLDRLLKENPGRAKELREHARRAAREERRRSGEEMAAALVSLSHFERRRLAAALRTRLDGYDRRRAATYGVPGRVLEALHDFEASAYPPKDRYLHMAALVLDVMPSLRRAFGPGGEDFLPFLEVERGTVSRFDVITGYLPILIAARSRAGDPRLDEFLEADGIGTEAAGSDAAARQLRAEKSRRLRQLDELIQALKAERRKQQQRFGFTADASAGKVWSFQFSSPIEVGKGDELRFQANGQVFKIRKIYQDFRYVPPYGREAEHGEGAADSLLEVRGKRLPRKQRTSHIKLLEVQVGFTAPVDVTANDEPMLYLLHHAISTRTHAQGLESTAAVIEGGAQAALELAELIPGWGQGLMVGRVSTQILQFISSPEFDALTRLLGGDLSDLLDAAGGLLKKHLSAEGLVEFLFFGNDLSRRLAALGPPPERVWRVGSDFKKGGIGKLLRRAKGAGYALARAVGRLETKVQAPVDRLQIFLNVRPQLSAAFRKAGGLLEASFSFDPERVKEAMSFAEEGLKAGLEDIFQRFSELRLPDEIISLGGAFELILQVLVRRMGWKVRGAWVLLEPVLQETGILDALKDEIDDGLKGTGLDPNLAWKRYVSDPLNDILDRAINGADGLIAEMYGALDRLGLAKLERPARVKLGSFTEAGAFSEDDFASADEEGFGAGLGVQPLLEDSEDEEATGSERRHIVTTLAAPAGGALLPPRVRASAERRFGHDFSHVRVHAGREAARVTEGLGAKALAAGSHVFLRDPSELSSDASSVVDHELAHVLDQTGPRPLGERHSSSPLRSRPRSSGPLLDLSGESAAERMARLVRGRDEGSPVPVEGRGVSGAVSPLSAVALGKLLRRLGSFADVETVVRDVGKMKKKDLKRATGRRKAAADALWNGISDAFDHLEEDDFPKFLKRGRAGVKKHLLSNVRNKMGTGVRARYTAAATLPTSAATVRETGRHAPERSEEPDYAFYPHIFSRLLEGYLLVKGGVALRIDLGPPSKADGSVKVKSVAVTGLYLPGIGGGSQLWKQALKTFTEGDLGTRVTVPADDEERASLDKEENFEKLREEARDVLKSVGASPTVEGTLANGRPKKISIFKNNPGVDEIRFSAEFARYVRREATSNDKLTDIPRWADYVTTTGPASYSNPGLRVGTYGQHSGRQQDRESHHTTQYLLIEYFINDTDKKPFRSTRDYPGLNGARNTRGPNSFKSSKNGTVDFARFKDNARGAAMPAILLSARSHKKGSLHVTPKSSGDGVRATQSGWMENTFTAALNDAFKSARLTTQWRKAQKKDDSFNDFTAAYSVKCQDAYFDAIQATYQEMRKIMIPALENVLPGLEMSYYRKIAKIKHRLTGGGAEDLDPDWDLQSTPLKKVFRTARTNNDTVMGNAGWDKGPDQE